MINELIIVRHTGYTRFRANFESYVGYFFAWMSRLNNNICRYNLYRPFLVCNIVEYLAKTHILVRVVEINDTFYKTSSVYSFFLFNCPRNKWYFPQFCACRAFKSIKIVLNCNTCTEQHYRSPYSSKGVFRFVWKSWTSWGTYHIVVENNININNMYIRLRSEIAPRRGKHMFAEYLCTEKCFIEIIFWRQLLGDRHTEYIIL